MFTGKRYQYLATVDTWLHGLVVRPSLRYLATLLKSNPFVAVVAAAAVTKIYLLKKIKKEQELEGE